MKLSLLAPGAFAAAGLLALAACSASPSDPGSSSDLVVSAPPGDAEPDDILGTLSGTCGTIQGLLADPGPSLVVDELTFAAGETYDEASLSAGGKRMFETPNAGGSSGESEAMSFEVLHFCEGASLLKTETEVAYDETAGSITDLVVSIGGEKVGVSVTRAYRPKDQPLTDDDVRALLVKKLEGIRSSSARVLPEDRWVKQILHVFAANEGAKEAIERVLPTIDATIRADTVVLVTVTKGGGFVYCNPDPPLGTECP